MEQLEDLIRAVKDDKDVIALILFGSFARGEEHRDIDVCVVLAKGCEKGELARKKMEYLAKFPDLDIHIFQSLPLYIRKRVIKEGKLIYCRDKAMLYDIVADFVKEFEDFLPIYKSYLEGVMRAR